MYEKVERNISLLQKQSCAKVHFVARFQDRIYHFLAVELSSILQRCLPPVVFLIQPRTCLDQDFRNLFPFGQMQRREAAVSDGIYICAMANQPQDHLLIAEARGMMKRSALVFWVSFVYPRWVVLEHLQRLLGAGVPQV